MLDFWERKGVDNVGVEKEKRIPPLRYGMEMVEAAIAKAVGWALFFPTRRKSAMDGAPGETQIPFGNDNKSRFGWRWRVGLCSFRPVAKARWMGHLAKRRFPSGMTNLASAGAGGLGFVLSDPSQKCDGWGPAKRRFPSGMTTNSASEDEVARTISSEKMH